MNLNGRATAEHGVDEERRAKSAIEGNERRKEREGGGARFETKGRHKNTLALVGRRCSQTHPRRVVVCYWMESGFP